jgi:hypothetical protein
VHIIDHCGRDEDAQYRHQLQMRTVIIKLPPAVDLSFEMAEMRGWLDHHSCVPSSFKYDLEQDSTIIQVQFTREEEAELFKRHFDGSESEFVNCEQPRLSPKI